MNLNSFQIRKICNLYALTGVWMECININRSGRGPADNLSKISQQEDWSCRVRNRREAPTWKWTVSVCVNTFFLKGYLTLNAALSPCNTRHWYLTSVHYSKLWTCRPGSSPEMLKQNILGCKSQYTFFSSSKYSFENSTKSLEDSKTILSPNTQWLACQWGTTWFCTTPFSVGRTHGHWRVLSR